MGSYHFFLLITDLFTFISTQVQMATHALAILVPSTGGRAGWNWLSILFQNARCRAVNHWIFWPTVRTKHSLHCKTNVIPYFEFFGVSVDKMELSVCSFSKSFYTLSKHYFKVRNTLIKFRTRYDVIKLDVYTEWNQIWWPVCKTKLLFFGE